jgi:MFS family permease
MEAPGVSGHDGVSDRKVTYSEIFAIREYRALFAATQLAWIGDYMVRAVVMVLVFVETDSIALAAAAFAVSYAPWLIGGPFLATLAERLRYRSVMWIVDVLRALLVALIAVPGVPLPVMMLLVFGVALLAPPGHAARSALTPLILTGERVVLGIAVNQASGQATQVIGYMGGAMIAAFNPRGALLLNAAMFATSAVIIRFGLRDRAPAMRAEQRSNLLRETYEGFQVVFGTPALRTIAIIVFASMLFAILPEGLAIGWADELAEGEESLRGFYQGLIMLANPLGVVLGGLLISRLLAPSTRRRLVPVFAVLAPLSLVPALAQPGIVGVVAMATICGFVMAGMTPTLNGMFVQILRHGYRARAFGVMMSGMQIIQGLAVLLAGLLTELLPLHQVVGLWSLAGVVLMGVLAARWPKLQYFNDAIAKSQVINRQLQEEEQRQDEQEAPAAQAAAGDGAAAGDAASEVPVQGGQARTATDPH